MAVPNRSSGQTTSRHPFTVVRFGLALSQTVLGLFGAGSAIFAAHSLFLRYYAREWSGIQIAGVNNCVGEDMVANGDLLEGKTFCNKVENFVPWTELYRRHWPEALLYYGVALVALIALGLIFIRLQQRLATTTPFGGGVPAPAPSDSEHLR